VTRALLQLLTGVVIAGLTVAPVRAGVIHTTFDPGLTYPNPFSGYSVSDADGPFGYVSTAAPFATPGPIPYRLDQVYSVSFASNFANPVYSLALYSSTGGPASTPDQLIATLSRELYRDGDSDGVSAVYRHSSSGEVILDPHTEYWLVGFIATEDAVPGLDGLWFNHDRNWVAHTIAYRFGPSDPWFREDVPNDYFGRPLFQVEATAIPEPASAALFVFTALGLAVVRRWRDTSHVVG
jgi:hypothetical protein